MGGGVGYASIDGTVRCSMLSWVYAVSVAFFAFGLLAAVIPTPNARVTPSLRPVAYFYRNTSFAAMIWYCLFAASVVILVRLDAYHPTEESDENPLYSTAATFSGIVVSIAVIMSIVYRLLHSCKCACSCLQCCCCCCCPAAMRTGAGVGGNGGRRFVRKMPCFRHKTDTLEEKLLSTAISAVLSGMASAFLPKQSWQHASLSYIGIFLAVMIVTAVFAELLAGIIVGIDYAVVLGITLVFSFVYIQSGDQGWPDRSNQDYGVMVASVAAIATGHVIYNLIVTWLGKRWGFIPKHKHNHSRVPVNEPVSTHEEEPPEDEQTIIDRYNAADQT